ncbi:MAG: IclR family transcriptional regulator [Telmatospirillum sp.]|nr:IclR family transcriptional regulator [Telmatospirillum sp.]
MAEERSDTGVKSVQVALDIIEAVAASETEVGVSELASRLGLTKATVFRHLKTLVERNYLVQNSRTTRYRLGIQCHLLGQISSNRVDLLSASEEAATLLRDETGQSVVVSAVRMSGLVVLATHLGPSPLQIGERPGSELSLYGSAQGRVAVAFSRKPLLAQVKRQKKEPFTPHTITEWPDLETKFRETYERGWADAPEELLLGLNALAAPIFDDTADCIGAIAIVGSIQHVPYDPDPGLVSLLLAAAERISIKLGFNPPVSVRRHSC